LLLLEVKDWKLDTVQSVDKVSATIITGNGLKTVSNPIEQVRQCTYQLLNRLQKDPQLCHQSGKYEGHLVFPYGFGVVLTSITRKEFSRTNLGEVLPEHQTICKDEMIEKVDPEAFQERLWNMFNFQFATPLTLPQIDRIRWHLFPEIRVNPAGNGDLFSETEAPAEEPETETLIPDIVRVMDKQQELLAKSLGEGHRVIHGVAGSGKTLILGYRCLYLAKLLHKPILVLCYNITLAAKLRAVIAEKGIAGKVSVYHFHDWCGEQLRTYHIDRPPPGTDYFDRMVEAVINAVDLGRIPRAQYGAVMIDEGHDFQPEWLKLVVGMVDPETDSLLLLYDDAQSIYSKKTQLDFSLSSVGVQARGRTSVLRMNYRNTDEVLWFAFRFATKYLRPEDVDDDHVPLVEPESAGRHGPPPAVKLFDSFELEARYVARIFRRLHDEQDTQWSDMCVSYRSRWMGEKLKEAMLAERVPLQWLDSAKTKKQFRPADQTVKLMTMHSSKGLEFPVVAVVGVGFMPVDSADEASEAKLLYVALTRSTEKLLVTAHKQTHFISELSIASHPAEMAAK
jgi:superfamily I DNA/RNA helicase